MADNYLGRKMEEYFARPSAPAGHRPAASLTRLLGKNRSHRAYDPGFTVREDQLRRIIGVNMLTPSARNCQPLRFRPVLSDEAGRVLPHIRLGGALPELHLPVPGTEPRAFIVICSAEAQDSDLFIDLGISAQSMLLQAVEIGLNGICIRAFDKARIMQELDLSLEPLLILAIGRGVDKIELVETDRDGDRAYYRRDGTHFVPKIRLDDLIIKGPRDR